MINSPPIGNIVPGGIKPTDFWHHGTNDGTCSRCRSLVPEHGVPLMLWARDGEDLLIYCESCMGWERSGDEGEDS